MFWSGNYNIVRGLNNLLKEENVTLTQVLEADDILQECKADNTALILFLTKSEVLAELITLIIEEPPKNVDMTSQYRHAHIASEVLTSQLTMLSDRLSRDVVRMNRLCDFVNKDPPLNPLLASYFSKTIEMLLERSPKQDWYLYHIVCLRVLDFFKSRRDFLPNLLRHISTSTIADIFKYFIRLEDPFNKIILEWLEENQFLESLIHIICGTYEPEEIRHASITDGEERSPDQIEKGQQETSEKVEMNHKDDNGKEGITDKEDAETTERHSKRLIAEAGRASANAAALLCDLLLGACASANSGIKPLTSWRLVTRLRSEDCVRLLLQCMFTSPPAMRRHAIVNGCQLLLALLPHDSLSGGESEAEGASASASVQRAIAPHLPLLHQALLRPPAVPTPPKDDTIEADTDASNSAAKPQNRERRANDDDRVNDRTAGGSRGNRERNDAKAAATDELANERTDERPNERSNERPNERPNEHVGVDVNANETSAEHSNGRSDGDAQGREEHANEHADENTDETKKRADTQANERAQSGVVGAARVHVAALIAQLAFSEVEDVHNALLTLGTAGVLIDMFFDYPQNNFLHTQVYILVHNALSNRVYGERYADHLIDDCNLMTRLMDTYEENENTKAGAFRRGNMGHVVLMLRRLELQSPSDERLLERWSAFHERVLRPLLKRHDTPLGGFYPSKNIYEYEATGVNESISELQMPCNNDAEDGEEKFYRMAGQRFDDGIWESGPYPKEYAKYAEADAVVDAVVDAVDAEVDAEVDAVDAEVDAEVDPARVREILADVSPWDAADDNASDGTEWANFGEVFTTPIDPFAPVTDTSPSQRQHFFDQQEVFTPFWGYGEEREERNAEAGGAGALDQPMRSLSLGEFQVKPMDDASTAELTNNLLTAMSSMAPDVIADIVSAMPRPDEPTADPAPMSAAPMSAAPMSAAPMSSAPVDPAPLEPAPVDTAPKDPAPVDPAPMDTNPDDSAPMDPAPALR